MMDSRTSAFTCRFTTAFTRLLGQDIIARLADDGAGLLELGDALAHEIGASAYAAIEQQGEGKEDCAAGEESVEEVFHS